jgi:hypothetical protein
MGFKSIWPRTLVAASSVKTAGFGNAQFCSEPARPAKFELTTSALRAALYPASPNATNKAD